MSATSSNVGPGPPKSQTTSPHTNSVISADDNASTTSNAQLLHPLSSTTSNTRVSPYCGQALPPTSPLACAVPMSITHPTVPSHSSMSLIQHPQPQQQTSATGSMRLSPLKRSESFALGQIKQAFSGVAKIGPKQLEAIQTQLDEFLSYVTECKPESENAKSVMNMLTSVAKECMSVLSGEGKMLTEAHGLVLYALGKIPALEGRCKQAAIRLLYIVSLVSQIQERAQQLDRPPQQLLRKNSMFLQNNFNVFSENDNLFTLDTSPPKNRSPSPVQKAPVVSPATSPPAPSTSLSTSPSGRRKPVIPKLKLVEGDSPKIVKQDSMLMCRICEQMLPKSKLALHSIFCELVNRKDMAALSVDEKLYKIIDVIQEKKDTMPSTQEKKSLDTVKAAVQKAIEATDISSLIMAESSLTPDQVPDTTLSEILPLIKEKKQALQTSAELTQVTWAISPDTSFNPDSPRLISPHMKPVDNMRGRPRSNSMPNPVSRLSINDFDILKPLTRGAYGKVFLVRKKSTGDIFCMKRLNRSELARKNLETIRVERDILAETTNPFVVKMYYSFASKSHVYFCMEYLPGGDLFSLLQEFGVLDESMARMYIAEMVLALEYLHSKGIIHRDIKPDNVLIDNNGHVKLTDFGLSLKGLKRRQATQLAKSCRQLCSDKAHTSPPTGAVGTPDYLAPELLMGFEHGPEVDFWSLGVVLYEFLTGVPPFNGDSVQEIFENILARNIAISTAARSLIDKLLTVSPEERIGHKGTSTIKSHEFFEGINWKTLVHQPAPFKPVVQDEMDTKFFEPRQEQYSFSLDEEDDTSSSSDAPEFDEFYFVNVGNLAEKTRALADSAEI